jgi:hypothetical protein
VLLLSVTSLCLLRGILGSSTAQTSERELDYKIPTHVPITIKLRKEKEKAVKDLRNVRWLGDFELEVANTSIKPIYFLELWVMLPEITSENGGLVGIPLRYGRMAFIEHDKLPLPDDVPIRPGETYTFKIPEKDQRGWYAHKAKGNMTDPKKLQIIFVQLSFGDGTGFDRTDAKPYPYTKEQSLIEPRQEYSNEVPKVLSYDLRIRFPIQCLKLRFNQDRQPSCRFAFLRQDQRT